MEQVKKDVKAYQEYNIKRYNGNEERASDEFAIREFLNIYTITLHVFHHGCYLDNKKAFNRWINSAFHMYDYDEFEDADYDFDEVVEE